MPVQTQEPTGSLSEDEVDNALGPLFRAKPKRLSERDVDAQLGALYPEAPGALQSFAGGALGSLADAAGYSKILSQKLAHGLGMNEEAPFFTDLEAGLRGVQQEVYPEEQRGRGGFGEQVAGGVGSVLGMAPAMATGPGGASYQFAASGAVPTYYAIKDAGGSEESATMGLILSSGTAQIQHFAGAAKSLKGILGKIAAPEILEPLKRIGVAEGLGLMGMGAAKGAAGQVVAGGLQQTLDGAIQEHFTGQDVDLWEQFKASLPVNATLGAVFGAIDHGVQVFKESRAYGRLAPERPQEALGGEIAPEAPEGMPAKKPPQGAAEGLPGAGKEILETPGRPEEAVPSPEGAVPPGEEPMGEVEAQRQQARDMEALTDEDVLQPSQEERRRKERLDQLIYEGEERRKAPERTPEEDLGDEAIRELEKRQPELLHAGVDISSEDIRADIGRVAARFKANKEVLEERPDILGNRKTLAFARKVVDYLEPHRRAKKARTGTTEGDTVVDYVTDEELRRSKSKTRVEKEHRRVIDPIKRDLAQGKIQLGEMDVEKAKPEDPGARLFRLAQHAEEGNAVIASRQPEAVEAAKKLAEAVKTNNQETIDFAREEYDSIVGAYASGDTIGVGMSNSEAKKILDAVAAGPKAKDYARLGKHLDALAERKLKIWEEYHLHPQEEIDAMRKSYKHFASLRSDIEAEGSLPIGRGVGIRGKETRMRTGRTTLPEDPIGFMAGELTSAIMRGEKVEVARRFADDLKTNKTFWAGVAKVTEGRKIKAVIDEVVKEIPDPSYGQDPNVIPFKDETGKQMYIEVKKEYAPLARALNNADLVTLKGLDSIVRVVGGTTRMFSKLRTIWSPEFLVSNIIRDVGTGVFTSHEQGAKFARKWGRSIPRAFVEYSKWKISQAEPTGILKEYVESGAPVSYLDYKSITDVAKDLEADLRASQPGISRKAHRAARASLAIMEGAADVSENATRYAAFKTARAMGKTVEQAAIIAKNLTVNFERKGELGHLMNTLWAFSSAGVTSSARSLRLLKHPVARRMALGAVAGMAVWDQIGRNMMGKDKDGEDIWDKLPGKTRYLHIPKYWTDDPRDTIRIPMPQQISWLLYGGEEIGAALSGDRDPGEAALNVASSALDQFNPLGSGSEKGMHKALKTVVPTVVDPLVDMLVGKDFTGRPYKPDKPGPESSKYWPDVSPLAKSVAQKMNEMTGGSAYRSGSIDVSPEDLEFAADAIFGGLGQFIRKTYTTATAAASHEPVDERNVPILSRFQGKVSPWASDRPFKDAMSDLRATEKEHNKGKAKTKDRGPAMERGLGVEKELEELQKKVNAAEERGNTKAADAYAERMDSLRQRFLRSYRRK